MSDIATPTTASASGITLNTPRRSSAEAEILTEEALVFLAKLEARFGPQRENILEDRRALNLELKTGGTLGFLENTQHIRDGDWKVNPAPADLLDRRTEITGPVDRKMVINALNSGANAFMADFEDSSSPTWDNMMSGQLNLRDAVNGTIEHFDPVKSKSYALKDNPAVLLVRPRGLHMEERHLVIDKKPISASWVDFGLYVFHNAERLLEKGSGPYLYIPKLEGHTEARLWDDVLSFTETELSLPPSSIRVTVLIETISAAFEMDEILYALRSRIVGLNCGRWDYIFSFIKKLAHDPNYVTPDRDQLSMDKHFLNAYSQLLINTCHKRGAHAMGGMSAFIPVKNDPEKAQAVIDKITEDKTREVLNGHDGTWVAHPGLVQMTKDIFNAHMPGPNQLDKIIPDLKVSAGDLLQIPEGTRSEKNMAKNIRVLTSYIYHWLQGQGCTAIDNLMEDAATAEIIRTQIWQWRVHGIQLEKDIFVTASRIKYWAASAVEDLDVPIEKRVYAQQARDIVLELTLSDKLEEFLTTPAYDLVYRNQMKF